MSFLPPKDSSRFHSIKPVLNGAEVVLRHCTPDIMKMEDESFTPFLLGDPKGSTEQQFKHPIVDFYGMNTTDFCKSNWRWRMFETAVRQFINDLFQEPDIKRLPEIMVAPQNAYHSSNIKSPLTVGKISRWTHLLDTCLNSVAQVKHHALADRPAEVGGKPLVKEAMLQCTAALLHDAAVYLFSHTGENALQERGTKADHDAVLLLLVTKLAKRGIFERIGLKTEEVLAAVFPPHFAKLFLEAKTAEDMEPLKSILLFWKDALGGVDVSDVENLVDLKTNQILKENVQKYKGTARYVHNFLDNVSYIPTDQGHHSRAEMLALMGCVHGHFFLSKNAIKITEQDLSQFSAYVRDRMTDDREYYFDRQKIQIGHTLKPVEFIVERRRVGANRESDGVEIPIFIRENMDSQHWVAVKIGKALLAKEECLRSSWASIDGNHDCVTSSVHGLYRIIKGQFDYARRKVTGISAAISSGFWERMLAGISFDPQDFLRLVDRSFILKYFPAHKAKLILGPSHLESSEKVRRGYDADISSLLRYEPRSSVDWFKEAPSRTSIKKVIAQLNAVIEEWKKENNIPASEDCYAALATSIKKDFEVKVVNVQPGTAFEFLKRRASKELERKGSTIFLKPLLRKEDTFSSRLIIDRNSFEEAHASSFDFTLEEFLQGAITVCISKHFMARRSNKAADEFRENEISRLKDSLMKIMSEAKVSVSTFDKTEIERPLTDYFKLMK